MNIDKSVLLRMKHLDQINANGRLTSAQIYEYTLLRRILKAYKQKDEYYPQKTKKRAVAKS